MEAHFGSRPPALRLRKRPKGRVHGRRVTDGMAVTITEYRARKAGFSEIGCEWRSQVRARKGGGGDTAREEEERPALGSITGARERPALGSITSAREGQRCPVYGQARTRPPKGLLRLQLAQSPISPG